MTCDLVIVGGGIVGLATALRVAATRPKYSIVVLEKEAEPGAHQTGHNSGVIHSGIYYQPGSTRARLCVEGGRLMQAFCREHGIPVTVRGKVVVAVGEDEMPALDELHRRGTANGVPGLALIGPEWLHEIEPHARGVRALHVPGAAVVDFALVARKMAEVGRGLGLNIRTGARVVKIRGDGDALRLEIAGSNPVRARLLVTCAGLHADRLARMEGAEPGARIVPFRGEYYALLPEAAGLVSGLIYPAPDARLPFLGVHFTRRIDDTVEAGPNAVLAFAREGYRKSNVNLRDLGEVLFFPGFWRLSARHFRTGAGEMWRSLCKRAFVRALRRLVPEIRAAHLSPGNAGVRAQALLPSGHLADDFIIVERPRAIHVCNAPSPAATASLALGEEIALRALRHLDRLG